MEGEETALGRRALTAVLALLLALCAALAPGAGGGTIPDPGLPDPPTPSITYPISANTVFTNSQYTELGEWMADLDPDGYRVDHIVNGSTGSNHHWEWLVQDKNWGDIADYIMNAVTNGNLVSEHMIEHAVGGYALEIGIGLSDGNLWVSTASVLLAG